MKKVLVFGYTKSGREVARELLSLGYEVILFVNDRKEFKQAEEDGYTTFFQENIDDAFLKEVGIGRDVEALFCMSHDDAQNLFVTLSSRFISASLKIVTVILSQNDEKKMLLAGANRTISPYTIGALRAFRLIKKPKLLGTIEEILLSTGSLKVMEVVVSKNSPIDGYYIKDLAIEDKYNIILLGILDHELEMGFAFSANGINHKIDTDDVLVVIGYEDDITRFVEAV